MSLDGDKIGCKPGAVRRWLRDRPRAWRRWLHSWRLLLATLRIHGKSRCTIRRSCWRSALAAQSRPAGLAQGVLPNARRTKKKGTRIRNGKRNDCRHMHVGCIAATVFTVLRGRQPQAEAQIWLCSCDPDLCPKMIEKRVSKKIVETNENHERASTRAWAGDRSNRDGDPEKK